MDTANTFISKNRIQTGIFGNGLEWNGVRAPVYWFGYSAYLDDRRKHELYIAVVKGELKLEG